MWKLFIKIIFPHCPEKHHKTVRHTFSLVFAALFLAGLASVVSQSESYISIQTTAETVTQDQQFVIEVKAFAHVPINAVDVVLSYPEDVMRVESIDTGTSVITLWTKEPYAENGSIYLRGGTFRKGFIGEHTIARIKAHATSPGEARVLIKNTQLIAGDGNGTVVETSETATESVKIVVTGSDGVLKAKAEISVVTDTDGDGDVDLTDIAHFMSAWLSRSLVYDFNGDGRMTFKDFSILLADSFFN
jgi:hypothetical protein